MESRQAIHDLAVALAVKQADDPAEVVTRYFELLEQVEKCYAPAILKRNKSREAIAAR